MEENVAFDVRDGGEPDSSQAGEEQAWAMPRNGGLEVLFLSMEDELPLYLMVDLVPNP